MREDVKNLKYVFEPSSIAVIGASPTTGKLGNVVLKNILDSNFEGKVYPVNPKYENVLGLKCSKDVHSCRAPR